MQVWIRVVIVWLIALALPVQGMAAATMAHCGQVRQRAPTAQAASAHHHAAGPAHHHADAADSHAVAHDGPSAQPKAATDPLDGANQKCSSCASCCAGWALPSALPRLPAMPPVPAVFADEAVSVDAFASGGPDRPPRSDRV